MSPNVNGAPPRRRRILHVAESFAGGVSAAILDYVDSTPEHEHHLLYSERTDAPADGNTALVPFTSAELLPDGHFSRIAAARKAVRRVRPDVVHSHSSFGGAYARLAVTRRRVRAIYTPHCYAFERRDIGNVPQAAFRLVEHILAFNTTAFAACSPREKELSKWRFARSNTVLLPNRAPTDVTERPVSSEWEPGQKFRVVGAGRASAQKDPKFFFDAVAHARAAGFDVDATWIGGDDELRALGKTASIDVTGWLPRSLALEKLRASHLYLHTAAWEGFPVAVLEAVSSGVPTVVRDIPAFAGLSIPSIERPSELATELAEVQRVGSTDRIRVSGREATAQFNATEQRRALQELYLEESH